MHVEIDARGYKRDGGVDLVPQIVGSVADLNPGVGDQIATDVLEALGLELTALLFGAQGLAGLAETAQVAAIEQAKAAAVHGGKLHSSVSARAMAATASTCWTVTTARPGPPRCICRAGRRTWRLAAASGRPGRAAVMSCRPCCSSARGSTTIRSG